MNTKAKVKELGEFIRAQRSGADVSLRKLAKLAGVSNPYLSQVERGLRHPSAEILQAIAKALRVSSQTLYVKAGILEDEPHPDVHNAVMSDPTLTEQQKQVLLQVYGSFRVETGRKRSTKRIVAGKSSAAKGKASSKTRASSSSKSNAKKVTKLSKASTARTASTTTRARRSSKLGGRTEMQADPSPHPAPLRPPVANVRTAPIRSKPRKEVG